MRPKLKFEFRTDKLGFAIDKLNGLMQDKEYTVFVYDKKQKRSLNQNALMHMWFDILGKEIGQSMEMTKEQMKVKFAPVEIIDPETGEVMIIGKPTHLMNKDEMTSFLDELRKFSMDFFNVRLPLPEDLSFEQLIEAHH